MELKSHTTRDLLALHTEALKELRSRGTIRTANNPCGDYAEALFATAFRWTLQNNSASGFDALAAMAFATKSRLAVSRRDTRRAN